MNAWPPPPGWATAAPGMWAREAERCDSMRRMSEGRMPEMAPMFAEWRDAWRARAERYGAAYRRRQDEAVAAVRGGAPDLSRAAFARAREADAEVDALVAAPWPMERAA